MDAIVTNTGYLKEKGYRDYRYFIFWPKMVKEVRDSNTNNN
jgi:hypothetical protein